MAIPTSILTDAEAAQDLLAINVAKVELTDALTAGYNRAATCTDLHPRSQAGTDAWGDTLAALRGTLRLRKWKTSREGNFETVIDPTGRYVIAVAPGNNATGRDDAVPRSKYPRGRCTADAVDQNAQTNILDALRSSHDDQVAPIQARQTWILLHFHDRTSGLIRAEFSLPDSMSGSYITSWARRILLDPIPYDGQIDVTLPVEPEEEIEVSVRRKAN